MIRGWLLTLASVLVLGMVGLSFGYVRSTTDGGTPLYWPNKRVTLNLRLGDAVWQNAAREAAAAWNKAGSQFLFSGTHSRPAQQSCTEPDFLNTVLWASQNCGMAFGDAIAITGGWHLPDGTIGDQDVKFDRTRQWNVYNGPLRFSGGEPIYELRRVAIHEFGHVLGLDHPDDHGQTVRAIMHSTGMNGTIETLQADDIAGVRAIYGTDRSVATTKGALGNPGHQTFKSGIGVISGWVCSAQRVEVQIGTQRIRMAYGTERLDTQGVCGDANNGFVTLVNFNRLQDGVHTARLIVDGRQIGQAHEFKVTTFGQEFAVGWEGAYTLPNFPHSGRDVLIGWDQGTQNFAILEKR